MHENPIDEDTDGSGWPRVGDHPSSSLEREAAVRIGDHRWSGRKNERQVRQIPAAKGRT